MYTASTSSAARCVEALPGTSSGSLHDDVRKRFKSSSEEADRQVRSFSASTQYHRVDAMRGDAIGGGDLARMRIF
jgi:hypothetical protein